MKFQFKLFKNPLFWLYTLSITSLLCYAAMKHAAFADRVGTLFPRVDWSHFTALYQSHALGFIVCTALAALIWNMSNKYAKWGGILVASLFLFVQCIDALIVQFFNVRFTLEQVAETGTSTLTSAGTFIGAYLHSPAGIFTVLFLISWFALCVLGYKYTLPFRKTRLLYITACLFLCFHFSPTFLKNEQQKTYLSDWVYTLFQAQEPEHPVIENIPPIDLTYQCEDGLNSRKNVVVILLESVSSGLSGYFSEQTGHLTPQLDKLARQHTAFTHHHSTNLTTSESLFGILTGVPTVHYYFISLLYKSQRFYQQSFPRLFSREGYYTAFLSSAQQVIFKDLILERAGFDEISDATDPFYKGHPRFVFDSVSDDVLFQRAEKWMTDHQQDTPYLLFIETTTSHAPFVSPLSGKNDFDETYLFADQALGDFMENLFQKHLLDNSVVLITSDHHSLWSTLPQESRLFGPTANIRVPLILINSPLKQTVLTADTDHIDLAPSLAYLILSKACFHPYQHNMFSNQKTRSSCIFSQTDKHKREVFIKCGNQTASLCLASNGVYFCGGDLASPQREEALSFIDWLRDHNRY